MTSRAIIAFLLALHLFLLPAHAFAAEEQTAPGTQELQNPFSDFVPFEDEYDVEDDERFMYFGRFFAVSLGTGANVFGGNIGELYNTALPILDLRLIYFFDFRLAGSIGFSDAGFAFNAAPVGAVNVNMMRLNADLKYYFDTKNVSAPLTYASPYAVGGVSQVFRTQVFQDHNDIEKDNAFGVSAGLGMEFALSPRKTSIGVEGRIYEIFFQDRYSQEYLPSGIQDLTGPMYSFTTNMIWFF
jgi:hypothetical protein